MNLQSTWGKPFGRSMGKNDQVRAPNLEGLVEGTSGL